METANTTLFMEGIGDLDESLSLFVFGYNSDVNRGYVTGVLGDPNQSMLGNLVLGSDGVEDSGQRYISLFMRGIDDGDANYDGGYEPVFTLYNSGCVFVDKATTLFIGETPDSFIPLFLKVDEPTPIDINVGLSMLGSAEDGMFAGVPLTTYTDEFGQSPYRSMSLFLPGYHTDDTVKNMNLVIDGHKPTVKYNSMFAYWLGGAYMTDLWTDADDSITLLIRGEGVTDDATPFNSHMNLVLERSPADTMPLYLQGPGEAISDGVELYVQGGYHESDSVEMVMPEVLGYADDNVRLYVHGW